MNESDDDMTTPVTRGELKQELADFEARLDARLDAKLDAKFAVAEARLENKLDAKFELLTGALIARMDARFEVMRLEMARTIEQTVARQTTAFAEHLRGLFVTLDDKYNDLPPRASRLEAAVFPPPSRARAVATSPKKRRRKAS